MNSFDNLILEFHYELNRRQQKLNNLREYILTHKIYDEVKFKSELLKIIGGKDE